MSKGSWTQRSVAVDDMPDTFVIGSHQPIHWSFGSIQNLRIYQIPFKLLIYGFIIVIL